MTDSPSPNVSSWDHLAVWIAEALAGKPPGFVLDLGAHPFAVGGDDDEIEDLLEDPTDLDEETICAQVHVLGDGVLLVRRSRTELGHLLLENHSASGVGLDRWFTDAHFDDCTDGYLLSRDASLIADICVTWLRDNWGSAPITDLGCDYRYPDRLFPESLHADGNGDDVPDVLS